MKVVLLGYMASGKSSIGQLLSKDIGHNFLDLDIEISKRVGLDIPTLFTEKGELFFRKKESEVLTDILSNHKDFVLSLGGGTPCYGNNMKLVKDNTPNSFYLNASIATLVQRIEKEKQQRPLVAEIPQNDLPEFIGKHMFERAPFYNMASYTIHTDAKTAEEITNEIKGLLL